MIIMFVPASLKPFNPPTSFIEFIIMTIRHGEAQSIQLAECITLLCLSLRPIKQDRYKDVEVIYKKSYRILQGSKSNL